MAKKIPRSCVSKNLQKWRQREKALYDIVVQHLDQLNKHVKCCELIFPNMVIKTKFSIVKEEFLEVDTEKKEDGIPVEELFCNSPIKQAEDQVLRQNVNDVKICQNFQIQIE